MLCCDRSARGLCRAVHQSCRRAEPHRVHGRTRCIAATAGAASGPTSATAAVPATSSRADARSNLFSITAKSNQLHDLVNAEMACAVALDLIDLAVAEEEGKTADSVAMRVQFDCAGHMPRVPTLDKQSATDLRAVCDVCNVQCHCLHAYTKNDVFLVTQIGMQVISAADAPHASTRQMLLAVKSALRCIETGWSAIEPPAGAVAPRLHILGSYRVRAAALNGSCLRTPVCYQAGASTILCDMSCCVMYAYTYQCDVPTQESDALCNRSAAPSMLRGMLHGENVATRCSTSQLLCSAWARLQALLKQLKHAI